MAAARHRASCQSKHGEIARFRSAARENQFVGFGAEKLRELIARIVDRRARFASRGMHARWIPEMSIEVRQHRLTCLIAKRRSRVVIEVDHLIVLPMLMLAIVGPPDGRAPLIFAFVS